MMRRYIGVTLLEMLLVMVVIAVLVLWNTGTYRQFVAQQAVEAQLARVATAIIRMRSEAITRNSSVQVCLANLKSNLDVQGCQQTQATADGFAVPEGLLFFIDSPGGRLGLYDSKEVRDVVPRQAQVTLFSSVGQYRIRPSGFLSVQGVRYVARADDGLCRQLWLAPSGSRQVRPC